MSEDVEFEKVIQAAGGIDAFLRQRGYDPDAVAERFREVAKKALEEVEQQPSAAAVMAAECLYEDTGSVEFFRFAGVDLALWHDLPGIDGLIEGVARALDAFAAARVAEAVAAERARIVERLKAKKGRWDNAALAGDWSIDFAEGAEVANADAIRLIEHMAQEDIP